MFATGFETGVQHGLNHGLKPRSNPGYNRVLSDCFEPKEPPFATGWQRWFGMMLKTKLQTKGANLVGTNDYTCWNEGYKGTPAVTLERSDRVHYSLKNKSSHSGFID